MKKLLTMFAIIVALANSGLIYPMTAEVVEIDYTENLVTIETATGFLYQFDGTEDYMEGDLVSCIMWSNGTENITDDAIINVRYSGYYLY